MKSTLARGISYLLQSQVHSHQLVPALFPDSPPIASMPRVLATAWLVALMEHACILALEPHLDAGEASVGTSIDLKHLAPTPEAIRITIEVRCVEVHKRRSVWAIVAHDEVDEIGRATHERMVVEWPDFRALSPPRKNCWRKPNVVPDPNPTSMERGHEVTLGDISIILVCNLRGTGTGSGG